MDLTAATDPLACQPAGTQAFIPTADQDRNGRTHCVYAGTGPTVLLAHGYLLDLQIFNLVFAALVDEGYRVIAFDQRGHGKSIVGSSGVTAEVAAADYVTLLEHFDVHEGTLVGHSMGGFLSLLFCLRHAAVAKQRLKRLVLLDANAGAVALGSLQNQLQMPLLKSGLLRPLWQRKHVGRALVGQLFGPAANPQFVELTRATLLRQQIPLSLPLLRAMSHDNYYQRLREIPIETRVLCGEADRTCPAWHSRKLGAELPHASNRWLPRIGHMMSYEAPDAILDAVRGK